MRKDKKEITGRDFSVVTIEIPVMESLDDVLKNYTKEQIIQVINTAAFTRLSMLRRNYERNIRRDNEQRFTHWPAFGIITSNDRLHHSLRAPWSIEELEKAIHNFTFGKRDK